MKNKYSISYEGMTLEDKLFMLSAYIHPSDNLVEYVKWSEFWFRNLVTYTCMKRNVFFEEELYKCSTRYKVRYVIGTSDNFERVMNRMCQLVTDDARMRIDPCTGMMSYINNAKRKNMVVKNLLRVYMTREYDRIDKPIFQDTKKNTKERIEEYVKFKSRAINKMNDEHEIRKKIIKIGSCRGVGEDGI